ncbi:hypothetical protein NIES37_61890 [Tolypothrix tenuis PCC 7101]|uniref:Uncharacterized protein n=1 Tax=Tolypothrix tenuis PCC 7101 TaxID=231146 RepID=A0A1Z4N8Y2_9CYAN|nr:hypothetical protein NIES37_61890 [Tolypothrix tenuis PCC 7101]BAZ73901.1 hypothetical protein NIES50_24680 [Aulosira laxa NIES-50]
MFIVGWGILPAQYMQVKYGTAYRLIFLTELYFIISNNIQVI